MEGLKQAVDKCADILLGWPDKLAEKLPEGKLQDAVRKTARIFACFLIMGAGIGIWAFINLVTHKFHFDAASLAQPTMMDAYGALLPISVVSVGAVLLFDEAVPEKYQNTAKKVLLCALPIFAAFAGACLIRFTVANSVWYPQGILGSTSAFSNPYLWIGGSLLSAGTLYGIGHAVERLSAPECILIGNAEEAKREKDRRLEEQRRLASQERADEIEMQEL